MLPFGNGHDCSQGRFQWYHTPANEVETVISYGRTCKEKKIYSVDELCHLCFNATSGTAGSYRLFDDDKHVDLDERRILCKVIALTDLTYMGIFYLYL